MGSKLMICGLVYCLNEHVYIHVHVFYLIEIMVTGKVSTHTQAFLSEFPHIPYFKCRILPLLCMYS